MFKKEYIFETSTTRRKRIWRNLFLFLLFLLTMVFLCCLYIPFFAQSQTTSSKEVFYQKSPDLIVVFTGDSGRLAHTFKMADKHPSSQIFISGVNTKNSLKTLLFRQGKGLSVEEFLEQESHHIDLDYLARNTVENVLFTLNYLQKNPSLKRVLIISSDYHLLRISLILKALRDAHHDVEFAYEGIESDYTTMRPLKMLLKEVFKILKASTFLFFWDYENVIQIPGRQVSNLPSEQEKHSPY